MNRATLIGNFVKADPGKKRILPGMKVMKFLAAGALVLLASCDNPVSMAYGIAVNKDTTRSVAPRQTPASYDSGANQKQQVPPPPHHH